MTRRPVGYEEVDRETSMHWGPPRERVGKNAGVLDWKPGAWGRPNPFSAIC